MKMKARNYKIILILFFVISFGSCNDPLVEVPYSEFGPSNFLVTQNGIETLLNAGYREIQWSRAGNTKIYMGEYCTDLLWETGGGLNRQAVLYINFQWDSSHNWFKTLWQRSYKAIRNANLLLDNLDKSEIATDEKEVINAEALFIRAYAYDYLYNLFGPTPLITSSTIDEFFVPRNTDSEIISFIETEYIKAIDKLPVDQPLYGKVTKGGAMALLCKFYLNTKQWQKCNEIAQDIIDLDKYSLYPDYVAMFDIKNEQNNEFIYVHPAVNQSGNSNQWLPSTLPPNYPKLDNQENYGAHNRYYDDFVNSFENGDTRRGLILTEYTNTKGEFITLLGSDNSRSMKYMDPNSSGRHAGNDIPEVRYADILLARAEALNQLNGPNQESIDLVNKVVERAKATPKSLSDFESKEALNDFILEERGKEFYTEAKRREDLIRHGKLISNAISRGKNAQAHHVLYPIPLTEMDANEQLEQNPGY